MARAKKLLARMQRSLSGWGQNDFHRLYTSYGFECREGGSHRFYTHPQFPQLTAAVARHNSLAKGYASDAVKILQALTELEGDSQETDEDEDVSCRPASVKIENEGADDDGNQNSETRH